MSTTEYSEFTPFIPQLLSLLEFGDPTFIDDGTGTFEEQEAKRQLRGASSLSKRTLLETALNGVLNNQDLTQDVLGVARQIVRDEEGNVTSTKLVLGVVKHDLEYRGNFCTIDEYLDNEASLR